MVSGTAHAATRTSIRESITASSALRSSLVLVSDNKSSKRWTLRSESKLGRLRSLLLLRPGGASDANGDDAGRPTRGGCWGLCCGGAADEAVAGGGRAELEAPEAQNV
eukprot:3999491-Prymnesium_polylepis.1